MSNSDRNSTPQAPVSSFMNAATDRVPAIDKITNMFNNSKPTNSNLNTIGSAATTVAANGQPAKPIPAFINPNNDYNRNANSSNTSSLGKRTLWSIYREKIMDAYNNRRIFTVYGVCPAIRQAMLNRGWLERLTEGRYPKISVMQDEILLRYVRKGNDYEAVALSRLLNSFPSYFIWQERAQPDTCADVNPYRNVIRRGRNLDFSTKIGLIGCSEHDQWYNCEGKSGMRYPRFYRLGGASEDNEAFIKDYKLTQCLSLARFMRDNMQESNRIYDFERGGVPISILNFALNHMKKCLRDVENDVLDAHTRTEQLEESAGEWKNFLTQSNEILHYNGKFRGGFKDILHFVRLATGLIFKFQEKYPNWKWDGYRNIWILKPGYQCRGNGIVVRHNLEDILSFTTSNVNRRYIAQKYIERPLLVYKTKFDIRQYMLVTIGEKLIRIWLYKDCYLKFSSQPFNLDDLSEAIHLTNNSVQRKYRNSRDRDPRLPASNMWSLERFQEYLKSEHLPMQLWETKIFKGIKENLIAVLQASLEETDMIPNAFELYGCDFMLDAHFNPILIEINSSPDMRASTEVTQRLCPNVLKDVVRVVVDLPHKPFASTGNFELIYEEDYRGNLNFKADYNLNVNGYAMHIRPYRDIKKQKSSIVKYPNNAKLNPSYVNADGKGVFLNRPPGVLSVVQRTIKRNPTAATVTRQKKTVTIKKKMNS